MLPWIFVGFAGFFVLERAFPGWALPRVRTWPLRVIAINAAQLAVVLAGGYTWERWFRHASIFELGDALPPWGGGVLAYFIATFAFYWWHRWRHESDWLWRHLHQIHHARAASRRPRRSTSIRWRWSSIRSSAPASCTGSWGCRSRRA
jgi:sterol desaturase/sphingolipid hydroxylase (fatty acid hydroxylase superfamily)